MAPALGLVLLVPLGFALAASGVFGLVAQTKVLGAVTAKGAVGPALRIISGIAVVLWAVILAL